VGTVGGTTFETWVPDFPPKSSVFAPHIVTNPCIFLEVAAPQLAVMPSCDDSDFVATGCFGRVVAPQLKKE